MKIQLDIDGDLEKIMKDVSRNIGLGTTLAVRGSAESLKSKMRAQVLGAGLGRGLASSIQSDHYPERGFSYDPVSFVRLKADEVLQSFEHGSVIRARNGMWLAIPTREAGRRAGKLKMSPDAWQKMTKRRLTFVHPKGSKNAFLVAEDVRISKRGMIKGHNGRRRRDGILTGAQSVKMFILIRQAKMPKKLDLARDVRSAGNEFPGRILSSWRGL